MTEEDTFNALKRSAYHTVLNEIIRNRDYTKILEQHNWTADDFWKRNTYEMKLESEKHKND